MIPTERNYSVEEAKMLAIIGAYKQWRHYVEKAAHKIQVVTDHVNLQTFLTTKSLSRREARWWEWLSRLDMIIKYQPGCLNLADGLSCCSDYEKKDEPAVLAETLRGTTKSVCRLSRKHSGEPVGQK